ncbi:MAG: hypothetical protein KBT75_14285 [Oleispira antarctica]|uniref:Uncharacterized protein n=1 Tax=Oleispira antarctica RB-8 TaxID=698738 RepID=R4YLG8_OLEAN|nr:hypothetical protein [Oleispira antarctica]MBQ0792243.1 hypothetical protein [Oleispira antarctica]CCK75601.1 conserved hypothetical protein [Oleispira antarctica RB-8]
MSPLFIVIFIVLAVFGSVYMLKPSPRQQRLAELRLDAIKLGLQVKLETFKTESKKMGVRDDVTATRYERFNPAIKSQMLRWSIVRQAGWEQEGLPPGWSWNNYNQRPDLEKLSTLLSEVGGDVQVIEVYDNRANIMTIESKASTAELINAWIASAQQL